VVAFVVEGDCATADLAKVAQAAKIEIVSKTAISVADIVSVEASCGSITIEATLKGEASALKVMAALESESLVIAVDGVDFTAFLYDESTAGDSGIDDNSSNSVGGNNTSVVVGVVIAVFGIILIAFGVHSYKAKGAEEPKEPEWGRVNFQAGGTFDNMTDENAATFVNPAYEDDDGDTLPNNRPTVIERQTSYSSLANDVPNLQVGSPAPLPTTQGALADTIVLVDTPVADGTPMDDELLRSLAEKLFTMFDDDLEGGEDTMMNQADLQLIAYNVHRKLDSAAVKSLLSESGISARMGRNAGGGAAGFDATLALHDTVVAQVQKKEGCTLQRFMQITMEAAVPIEEQQQQQQKQQQQEQQQ